MYKYSQYNIVVENLKEYDSEYVILFNSYSGGILKLEKSIFNKIYRGEISQLKQNDLDVLLKGGYVLDENINEFNRVKNRYALECINQKPEKVSYVIAPTLNCNLHCVYCFQKDKRNDIDHIMSDETLKQVINFIVRENNNNDNLKKIVINWFGGEPLLCFDIIDKASKKIIEAFKQKNILIETNITTNGVLLNKSKLRELTDSCNLRHVQITLDGEMGSYCAKKVTTPDVFNKVINNVIDASKVVKVTIRLNADKKNYNEFINLINFIYASGVNKKNIKIHYAQLRNYTNEKTTEDFLDDYEYFLSKTRFYKEQQIKFEIDRNTKFIPSFNGKSFCGLAQKNNFVIDDYGNLYKCEHYLGDKDKIVGDVVNGLYYNEQLTKAIQDEKCSMCELYPCCNYVQCPVMYEFTGQEKCMVYPNQNKTIKSKIKNYIGANTYDKETEKKS